RHESRRFCPCGRTETRGAIEWAYWGDHFFSNYGEAGGPAPELLQFVDGSAGIAAWERPPRPI
ncbi:MAG: hypothetical protein RJP95_03675, partial [Pirellulales bacterium]